MLQVLQLRSKLFFLDFALAATFVREPWCHGPKGEVWVSQCRCVEVMGTVVSSQIFSVFLLWHSPVGSAFMCPSFIWRRRQVGLSSMFLSIAKEPCNCWASQNLALVTVTTSSPPWWTWSKLCLYSTKYSPLIYLPMTNKRHVLQKKLSLLPG